MGFTMEELAAYEKQPQTQVDDKANPFDATAAAAKEPATKTPAAKEPVTDPASSADPASDPNASGDGTSDAKTDSSTVVTDPDSGADPGTGEDDPDAAGDDTAGGGTQPPKKGSARERIQELADERDGYRAFGQHLIDQYKTVKAELDQLKAGKPAAAATTVVQEAKPLGPLPQLDDPDINFDPKVLADKQAAWIRAKVQEEVQAAVKQTTGQQTAEQAEAAFAAKVEEYGKTHKDFNLRIKNPALPKLSDAASAAIGLSDIGPELLDHISSDIGLAQRIAKLPPVLQAVRIGEISAELKAKAKTTVTPSNDQKKPVPVAKTAQKKTVSNAPPPPSVTPAGNRSQERDEQDPSLNMDDFARRHREGKNAARQASRKARGLA